MRAGIVNVVVEDIEFQSFRMLMEIYEMSKGKVTRDIHKSELRERMGLELDDIETCSRCLKDDGLIERNNFSGSRGMITDPTYNITIKGIKEVTHAKDHPLEPAPSFPSNSYQMVKVYVNQVVLGDNYNEVKSSSFIKDSTISDSFNKSQYKVDDNVKKCIESVSIFINQSDNVATKILWESFLKEINTVHQDRSRLKTIMETIRDSLSNAEPITGCVCIILESLK